MRKCASNQEIPFELQGEDVYDMLYIFNNEDEAISYLVKEYNINKDLFYKELHEEDFMRNEFGKENYLRSASIDSIPSLILSELINGEYILWEAY